MLWLLLNHCQKHYQTVKPICTLKNPNKKLKKKNRKTKVVTVVLEEKV